MLAEIKEKQKNYKFHIDGYGCIITDLSILKFCGYFQHDIHGLKKFSFKRLNGWKDYSKSYTKKYGAKPVFEYWINKNRAIESLASFKKHQKKTKKELEAVLRELLESNSNAYACVFDHVPAFNSDHFSGFDTSESAFFFR